MSHTQFYLSLQSEDAEYNFWSSGDTLESLPVHTGTGQSSSAGRLLVRKHLSVKLMFDYSHFIFRYNVDELSSFNTV